MKCRVGLLGLPNVGKSSLFNALAQQSIAQAANFPFCTIDPNVAPIPVPDPYLNDLGSMAKSTTVRPATMDWIDVAGLAPNAHKGEGLGNQFLGTLRECHALCHVVRVFENISNSKVDEDVHHVTGCVDPIADIELIQLELILADLEHVQRRLGKTTCQGTERQVLEQIEAVLQAGKTARALRLSVDERFSIKGMGLLTLKPVLYAFNVDEVDFTMGRTQAKDRIANEVMPLLKHAEDEIEMYAIVSAKLEANLYKELSSPEARSDYLVTEMGMEEIENDPEALLSYMVLPDKVKELLNLAVVYTGPGVPPERSRTSKAHLFSPTQDAWTASELAGRLHGDIQKGFIRADVVSAPELLQFESLTEAKDAGRVRLEGRNYPIAPNDVVLVKWK